MSKKKEKTPVSSREVEEDLLAMEGPPPKPPGLPSPAPGMQEFHEKLLLQMAQQHKELVNSIKETQTSGTQAIINSVRELVQEVPDSPTRHEAPYAPTNTAGLFDCAEPMEEEEQSEDELDFIGWDFPTPGQPVHSDIDEPMISLPSTSQASKPASVEPAPNRVSAAVAGLFSHDLEQNWDPPVDIMQWYEKRTNMEVPNKNMKTIDESFVPNDKFQALFKAPPLPAPIADRLNSAPKYLVKIPKMVNDMLTRAQKELVVAQKPLLEVSFTGPSL